MNNIYTGVGSRETPEHILQLMFNIASALEASGWLLRTGDADGADEYFRKGVSDPKNMSVYTLDDISGNKYGATELAKELALKYHPAPQALLKKPHYLFIHARNVYQILGTDFDDGRPLKVSDYVICYTDKGEIKGGTGQVLRIAQDYKVPVINLGIEDVYKRVKELDDTGMLDKIFDLPRTVT